MLTKDESQRLQKDGATARALGKSEIDNPFYRPENCPAATGEATPEWEAKASAWRVGWLIEHEMRGGDAAAVENAIAGLLRR